MASSIEVGRGHVTLSTEDTALKRGLASARQTVASFLSNITIGLTQGLGQALFSSITQGIKNAFGVIQQGVTDASNLTESINKVGVAFGSSSKDILEWSKTAATAIGLSQQKALEAASGFGLMFGAMGLGREQSAEMSKSLVQLGGDLASVFNSTPEEALLKLRAGLVGEAEPLRVWGVLLDEAAVAQKGVQMGLAATSDALTSQDKVMARYQLILEQTAAAQGDVGRTGGELAGSQRRLTAQLEEASAKLGAFFLPVQLAFTKGMSELLTAVGPFGLKIMQAFANGLADGIVAITPVLVQVKSLFTYLLEAHSPPRLLPDLMKWGASAMQAYLEGWSMADFNALRDLGGAIEGILRSFVGTGDIKETDIVGRVFGSQKAIANAIKEFRNMGSVSQETLNGIADAAGPAGAEIAALVGQYFELQKASQGVKKAQDDLNEVTRKYSDALRPINDQLDAVRDKQDEIRDNKRLQALGKELTDPTKTVDEHQLARLEIQQIELEKQAGAIEKERDVAVDASQAKIDAATKEEAAQQAKLDTAQAALDQQVKTNNLITEEIALRTRLADEALADQKKALADLEEEQRKATAADEKRLAALEAIHQAQLGFNLASSDTAGQLALLRAELDRTTKGSADYFDIMTRMVPLQQKLAKEAKEARDAAAAAAAAAANLADKGVAAGEPIDPSINRVTDALNTLFKQLESPSTVKLNPFFQGIADAIKNIGDAATAAKPLIADFLALFSSDDAQQSAAWDRWKARLLSWGTSLDTWFNTDVLPTWKASLLTWGTETDAWFLNEELPRWKRGLATIGPAIDAWGAETGPKWLAAIREWSKGTDTWFNEEIAPAWKTNLDSLSDTIDAWGLTLVDKGGEAIANFFKGILDWVVTNGAASWAEILGGLHTIAPDIFPAPGSGTPSIPLPGQRLPDMTDPNASFPSSGLPGMPLLASSTVTNGSADTVVFNIEQHIGSSGDFGGARSGALEGMNSIRQALLTRKLGTA